MSSRWTPKHQSRVLLRTNSLAILRNLRSLSKCQLQGRRAQAKASETTKTTMVMTKTSRTLKKAPASTSTPRAKAEIRAAQKLSDTQKVQSIKRTRSRQTNLTKQRNKDGLNESNLFTILSTTVLRLANLISMKRSYYFLSHLPH